MLGNLFGMGYGGYYGGYYFSYLIYILPAFLLAMLAQMNVSRTFGKYSRIMSLRGLSGEQVARRILDENSLYDVRVEQIRGRLSDHYDPRTRVVRLSVPVFSSTSVAAIGVAAHETGHAVQHSHHYAPLTIRNAIIPVTQFSSSISIWLVIIGLMIAWQPLAYAGIMLFSFAVVFQLITLPVEFNASSRALKTLDSSGMLYAEELKDARKVLRAAALTYVAATAVAFAQLFRMLAMVSGGSRKR
jgi:Zn-dependent membrane protease YugP